MGCRYGDDGMFYDVGSVGSYWSSTANVASDSADGMDFTSDYADYWNEYAPRHGFSVRAVAE